MAQTYIFLLFRVALGVFTLCIIGDVRVASFVLLLSDRMGVKNLGVGGRACDPSLLFACVNVWLFVALTYRLELKELVCGGAGADYLLITASFSQLYLGGKPSETLVNITVLLLL